MLLHLKLAILSRLLPWLLKCPFDRWEELLEFTGKLDAKPMPNEEKTQAATFYILESLHLKPADGWTPQSTAYQLARRAAQAAVLYRRIRELLTFPF